MADPETGTEQGVSNAAYEMDVIADTEPARPYVVPAPDEPSDPPPMMADQQEPPPTLDDLHIPPPPDELPPPPQSEDEMPLAVIVADIGVSDPANMPQEEPSAPPAPPAPPPPPAPPAPPALEDIVGEESPQIGNGEVSLGMDVPTETENASEDDDIAAVAHEYQTVIEMKDDNDSDKESPSPSPAPSTSASDSGSAIHNASTLPSTKPMMITRDEDPMTNGNYGMTPGETKAAMKVVNKYRRESMMWLIIFIIATGLIAVIFYFTYSILVAQIDPIPDGPFHFRVIVQLRNRWTPGLEVSSNPIYTETSKSLIKGVNNTFTSDTSTFADVYQTAEVFSFTPGNTKENIRASFLCYFSGSPGHLNDQDSFNVRFEAELREGFEDGVFIALDLLKGEPITIVGYTSTDTGTPATTAG